MLLAETSLIRNIWNRQLLEEMLPELLSQYISSNFQERPRKTAHEFFRDWPRSIVQRCSKTGVSMRNSADILVQGFVKFIAAKDPPLFPAIASPPNIHHLLRYRKSLCYQNAESDKAHIAHVINRSLSLCFLFFLFSSDCTKFSLVALREKNLLVCAFFPHIYRM